jgi:serine/tyrosine/threonine adenylyltransferase
MTIAGNPLLSLNYEPALEILGDDYYDIVSAADFPTHTLRWRNDALLPILGAEPNTVTAQHFIEAFGQFAQAPRPLLALRYHGYQFQHYNPALGDGRGFLYGQVRGSDDLLYDLGTKGSGQTPYSRGGDGRLTLKGGVREVIAAEALQRLGVTTSRCLSLVETGEQLWRGDEPSPTRSSVMVRMQRSHIRFGTFERLNYLKRKDLIAILLDHVIEHYYPHLLMDPQTASDRYARFYADLVQRVAALAAQWLCAGFCHAVLNTDNMAITGESFDYGPFAFIPTYDPSFTAAYFDHSGLYAYANQPGICQQNLQLLQAPLSLVISPVDLEAGLEPFADYFQVYYRIGMMRRLGFAVQSPGTEPAPAHSTGAGGEQDGSTALDVNADGVLQLLRLTLQFLKESQISYSGFFAQLAREFSPRWREDAAQILPTLAPANDDLAALWQQWQAAYFSLLLQQPEAAVDAMSQRLRQANPQTVPLRPLIETVWDAITTADDWAPFAQLIRDIQQS